MSSDHLPADVLAGVLLERAQLLLVAIDVRDGADPAHAVAARCTA